MIFKIKNSKGKIRYSLFEKEIVSSGKITYFICSEDGGEIEIHANDLIKYFDNLFYKESNGR